jgi:hypothetical protein
VDKTDPTNATFKILLDEFRSRAPEAARALAQTAGQSATEAWQQTWRPWEGLQSPAGKATLVGGAVLFAAGWLIGRKVRVPPRAVGPIAAAVAGGVAAGMIVGARSCRKDDGQEGGQAGA